MEEEQQFEAIMKAGGLDSFMSSLDNEFADLDKLKADANAKTDSKGRKVHGPVVNFIEKGQARPIEGVSPHYTAEQYGLNRPGDVTVGAYAGTAIMDTQGNVGSFMLGRQQGTPPNTADHVVITVNDTKLHVPLAVLDAIDVRLAIGLRGGLQGQEKWSFYE